MLYSPSKGELEGTVNSHENREIACNQKLIFEQVCDINSYYVVSPKTLQARNLDISVSHVVVPLRPVAEPDGKILPGGTHLHLMAQRSFVRKFTNKMNSQQLKIDKHIRK